MKIAGFVFFLFFYLYVPEIIFLPVSIRLIIGALGLLLYAIRLIHKYSSADADFSVNKDFLTFWIGTIAISLVALVVVVINGSADGKVISEIGIRFTMLFGGAYFLTWYLKQMNVNMNYQIILKAFIAVLVIQCFIGVGTFVNPVIKEIFNAIQKPSDVAIQNKVGIMRMSGFGMTFFGAGLDCGLALMILVFLFRENKFQTGILILLAFVFLFILAVGTFMARTTLIGALFAFGYLILPHSNSRKHIKFAAITSVILIVVAGYSIPVLLNSEKYGMVIRFAFEAFFNYSEYGSLETESSNDLQTMYRFPEQLKTYFIGDGWLNHPEIEGYYYKQTDVGYLRLIYFGGVFYALLWFLFHYLMLNRIVMNINSKEIKMLALTIFFFLVVVNVKGLADFYPLVFLLLVFSSAYKSFQKEHTNAAY